MVAALNRYMRLDGFTELVIFGHSGGGTLALLLADRIPQTLGIVTLAGNLDIDRWTKYHGYNSLTGSINPARNPPINRRIWEIHYVGSNDRNILPEFVRPRAAARANVQVKVIEGFDHTCCWQRIWPDILRQVAAR